MGLSIGDVVPTQGAFTVLVNLATTSDAVAVQAGSGLSQEEHDRLNETLTLGKFLGLK